MPVKVSAALLLFVAKMVAAFASESIGVLSTAIDAGLDLFMSLVVLAGVLASLILALSDNS